ncbi:MAG: nitrous oxide reductase accessory protein NosL [Sulfurimonas sp.]|nr:nitrous oxide reductase accessory protein NosL [Sulfurimonas sp.]
MKKTLLIILALFLVFTSSSLFAFSKEATSAPVLVQDGKHKDWCPVCGMDIKKFYKTSHTSTLQNDKKRQYCSIRCLAVDMQEHKIDINSIKVVDAATDKLIDAKSAIYVVDSDIRGTMTKVSKLAFSSAESADDFNMDNGGYIVDFATALKMANESLKSDIAMVTKKKTKKIYPMGKKIFEKSCNKDIEPKDYIEINQLKSAIKHEKLCKPLKENQLQAVALYLFEVKRFGDMEKIDGIIKVTKDEKCPICGMFVYKYPKWAAQIYYEDKHYSFDGVKDLMKYYFTHKDGISKILVTDYYSQKAIDATKAFFVVGSDVYGPMGDELIPFVDEREAKTFSMDHKGYKILKFSEISEEEVRKLDE